MGPRTGLDGRKVGPRTGLDGWKISSSPIFDPGPTRPWSVAIPTELPDPLSSTVPSIIID